MKLTVSVTLEADGWSTHIEDSTHIDTDADIQGYARELGRELGAQVETEWHSSAAFIRKP